MSSNQQESLDISTPEKIKDVLHARLKPIGNFDHCALLDYPDYFNIGDHLIWLGTIFYLIDTLKVKIKYAASLNKFSAIEMEKEIGQAPILLQGGGNLGDLWPRYQMFREQIISKYLDRPIVILPQSIYFTNRENLLKSADVFNAHPNLTLFVRDNYSYQIASEYFGNCQIIKAPDMAFQMVNMPGLSFSQNQQNSILYLCRQDKELNHSFADIKLPNLKVEDWISYQWLSREKSQNCPVWYGRLPGIVRLIREGWQRGLAQPKEFLSRQIWENFHPYSKKINSIYNPAIHRKSWSLMHSGIFQFKRYPLVITNRLHGHILCVILGIPHIFLPNSYYKNEQYYQTWSNQISFCRFVKDKSEIAEIASELATSYRLFN